MKEARQPFSWKTYLFDCNSQKLEAYDVLKYREKFVKDLKKKCTDKAEFTDKLFSDFGWQYWSRCEYEMILYIKNDRVFVQPWAGIRDPELHKVDITDYQGFDWLSFAKHVITEKGWRDGTVKIDVFDQLEFKKQEIVDFCWNYKHKYQ